MAVFNRELLGRAKAFASQTPSSPLATHYWSTTPYRLGDRAVKYMARSPRANPAGSAGGVNNPDGLAAALSGELDNGPASFDFGVHVQQDAMRHPVEDATVNWSAAGAPFVPLARIEISGNTIGSNAALAENLVFSPWHALEAHRPLGVVNRARRDVYLAMAKRRHELNGIVPAASSEVPAR